MTFQKLILGTVVGSFLFVSACNQTQSNNSPEANLSTKLDSVSYALGYQNGSFLAREGVEELNYGNYNAGMSTGISGEDGLLTQEQIMAVTNSYLQELNEKQSSDNAEEGESFLEENKSKEGVQVTDSGLQYKVIEEGDGASPTAENVVRVHYEGKLLNGEVFDSSYERGEPAEFPLNRVIPGWTEGVQLMQEGATYEFYIPSDLAYGARPPQGSPIGPNQTLIFKVELLEVKEAQ
ncbi:FKBP-type peptidyl-prolyl cis-trans isomerase [Gracilimonas mengyeensis]|uniref:Peptidyl-prolyl cis-trans isomerase n=1 Tax=Gracilimonas mengyeensis TaxID=1302730 RepID=A0A521AMH2_9BACT|nr:FKBP-type peptidyl-prolyl cis-trans isomerase [Gracilimonas mengyeensis]SMO35850.1 FKBP-type peptidyl-prolyl cis-trans isomerase FkpA/FKBP-type peptidyl-prolyl cis-trans isomerase FklB [Gracilimonas mengyeensis]